MATEYIIDDAVGEGIILHRTFNDANVVIDKDVIVGSTDSNAIFLSASFHDVVVRGTVSGHGLGVILGDHLSNDQGNTLHVAEGGLVRGESFGFGAWGGVTLLNEGTVRGASTGALFNLAVGRTAVITNHGLLSGGTDGIWTVGAQTLSDFSLVRLTNTGTIEGGENAYRSAGGRDNILNLGVMQGNIHLHDHDDRFDNRRGVVLEGAIYGGEGADTFLPGAGVEQIYGDGGHDALDFRGSAGLRVSLLDDSGTGWAEGDIYRDIDLVRGSRAGGDTLIGDYFANTLMGYGGADTLSGGEGHDVLIGGTEADHLAGDWGNDAFAFSRLNQCGDQVLDFTNAKGNDDRIEISRDGFRLSEDLPRDTSIATAHFRARTADNLAQDGDDYFIFRKDDQTLWFDQDGNGALAAVLIADLQKGASLSAADIFLV